MRSRLLLIPLTAGALFVAAGCATSEEWQEWRSHSSHYASGHHLTFSWRNPKDAAEAKVYRRDIDASRKESWWGYVLTVQESQIFQN